MDAGGQEMFSAFRSRLRRHLEWVIDLRSLGPEDLDQSWGQTADRVVLGATVAC